MGAARQVARGVLLGNILARHRVDERRVCCLTGPSLGGAGAWMLAGAYPERFADALKAIGDGC